MSIKVWFKDNASAIQAISTAVLVIITALYAGFTYSTMSLIKESNNYEIRPYVTISPIKFEIDDKSERALHLGSGVNFFYNIAERTEGLLLELKNIGKVPAVIKTVQAEVKESNKQVNPSQNSNKMDLVVYPNEGLIKKIELSPGTYMIEGEKERLVQTTVCINYSRNINEADTYMYKIQMENTIVNGVATSINIQRKEDTLLSGLNDMACFTRN